MIEPIILEKKAVKSPPNLLPIHHPIQPKTIIPINIQSLFISYLARMALNNDYTSFSGQEFKVLSGKWTALGGKDKYISICVYTNIVIPKILRYSFYSSSPFE